MMSPLSVYLEHAIPTQLSKLRHMSVEHVHAGILVCEFQNAALRLALDDSVSIFTRSQTCAGGIVVEKVRVQVKGVDEIELQDVDEIDTNRFTNLDLDG